MDTADGCATPHSGTGINSLEILGLSIDQNFESIVNYTNDQFTTLLNAVTAEVNDGVLTPPSPSPAPFGNFTQLLVQCISTARDASLSGSYLGSAQAAAVAAYDVFSKATDTSTFIAADANFPNPPGLVRSLIAAPEFSTRVRLGGGDATPPPYVLTQPSATNPVDIRPTVTGSPTTHATVGQQYSYAPGTATFFGKTKTLTYSLTVTGPSQWLTLSAPDQNNQVQVIGTPTVPGQYTVTFTETDGCEMNQTTASSSWKIKVTGKP